MRLIDADELKKAFESWKAMDDYYHDTDCDDIPLSEANDLIDNAPTVKLQMGRMTNGIIIPIEQSTGEWIKGTDEETGKRDIYPWTCSECKGKYPWQPNYCPNCGAKMKGETNDVNTNEGRIHKR